MIVKPVWAPLSRAFRGLAELFKVILKCIFMPTSAPEGPSTNIFRVENTVVPTPVSCVLLPIGGGVAGSNLVYETYVSVHFSIQPVSHLITLKPVFCGRGSYVVNTSAVCHGTTASDRFPLRYI